MILLDIFNKIFAKDTIYSKDIAKERLRLVLVHDRSSVSPELMNKLKEDLMNVIKEYMEVDESCIQVDLSSHDDSMALIANIPVKGFRRAVNE